MVPVIGKTDSADGPERGNIPRRLVYTVPEVAQLLGGVTDRFVWSLVAAGELPSKKLGRRRVVEHDALQEFIAGLKAERRQAQDGAA